MTNEGTVIHALPEPTLFPVTHQQQGVWFHALGSGTRYWNFVRVKTFRGQLNVSVLSNAVHRMIMRHSSLRTNFVVHDDQLYQNVLAKAAPEDVFEYSIHKERDEVKADRIINAEIAKLNKHEFNYEADLLLKFRLMRFPGKDVLILLINHIITDVVSIQLLWDEIKKEYNALRSKALVPASKPGQYSKVAIDQRELVKTAAYSKQKEQWLAKLGGDLPALDIQFYSRKQQSGLYQKDIELPSDLIDGIRVLSLKNRVIYSSVFQAAYLILLWRYSRQPKIIIGNVLDGRSNKLDRGIMGLFAKKVVNIHEVQENDTVADLLRRVNNEMMQGFANADVPYEELIRDISAVNKSAPASLYRAAFNMVKQVDTGTPFKGVTENQNVKYKIPANDDLQDDINLYVIDHIKKVSLRWEIRTSKQSKSVVGMFMQGLQSILITMIANPAATVRELAVNPLGESNRIKKFSNDKFDFPADQTIVSLLARQVARTPNKYAVSYSDQSLTYRELDRRATAVAKYLSGLGVSTEDVVPICLHRSLDMIVGIIGIMKAGAAYVPVDPDYPLERIKYIIDDTAASVIVSTSELSGRTGFGANHNVVNLDSDWDKIEACSSTISGKPAATTLAYIIYTSGSTGMPKGVMVEHQSAVNNLLWAQKKYKLTSKDVVLQKTTFCFDVSVWELIWPLLNGARMVFADPGGHKDNDYLRSAIDRWKVSIIHFVPSMLEAFLLDLVQGECRSLKMVLASGEALKTSHVEMFRTKLPDVELHNLYGPTEAAIHVTHWAMPAGDANLEVVPIGKPVGNTTAYITDHLGNLLPIGVAGDLFIGGVQVARGYLNRQELTNEKFVADPFSKGRNATQYKTGDVARWQADGNIEFLGRRDEQVKINGYRIELGEIESALNKCAGIVQSAVVANEDHHGLKRLIAYIVTRGAFSKETVSNALAAWLPEYMIPRSFIKLLALPLNSNGKINRAALPAPDLSNDVLSKYVGPVSAIETTLAAIWKELLGVERIGIHDDFFELGGHSLSAMRAVSAMRKKIEVDINIKDVFIHTTISQLAQHVGQQKDVISAPAFNAARPAKIPLSFGQMGLWLVDQLEGNSTYHVPWVVRLFGHIDIDALAQAFSKIVNRHEVLRTVIREEDGQPYQYIMPPDRWQLNVIEKPGPDDSRALNELVERLAHLPFNLSNDDMLRAHLIKCAEEEHVLVVIVHHIAMDGWSFGILKNELRKFYDAAVQKVVAELPPLPLQYADFATWQQKHLTNDFLSKKLYYWKQQLTGVGELTLPVDKSHSGLSSAKGKSVSIVIDKKLNSALRQYSQQQGATLFMTMLAGLNVLLHRYSGAEDISIGSPVAGRQHKDLEGLIGFFVNTVVLRSRLNYAESFSGFLSQVKQTTLEAYENQDVPLEKVMEALGTQRERSRNFIFNVKLAVHNVPRVTTQQFATGVALTSESIENVTAHLDFSFDVFESGETLQLIILYASDLYNESTVQRIGNHFMQLLQSAVVDPSQKISTIDFLSSSEKNLVLEVFNNTRTFFPKQKSLIDLFQAHVKSTPSATAIVFEEYSMSYLELDERSEKLANYLHSLGVREDDVVPLCIERGLDMIVAIVGILKSGGAYLPIDPEYPEERIRYIIEDSGAGLILSGLSHFEASLAPGKRVVSLDWDMISLFQPQFNFVQTDPHSLAYIIYTSGSTGAPKGVLIEREGLVNLIQGQIKMLGLQPGVSFLQFASYAFDAASHEIFCALCSGGKLVVCRKDTILDAIALSEVLTQHKVEIAVLPPSFQPVIAENVYSLKTIISAGERMNYDAAAKLISNGIKLINGYGPTENTVAAVMSASPFLDDGNITIGKPIDNVNAFILDKNAQLVPVGVTGELCIGGVQLARGYLNRPELTAERFVSNPFQEYNGSRLYKTGDLARWLPDGNIDYRGRIDNQVKLRGNRIELGEIERVIEQCEMVKQAAVVVAEDNNTKRLIAFVTPNSDTGIDKDAVFEFVKSKVPEFMVPSSLVTIDSFPLNSNGKIDRKKLETIETDHSLSNDTFVAPGSEIERTLATIWSDLLGVDSIGIHDNFFELGGDSIITIQIVSRIRNAGYELQIGDIFDYQTISKLSSVISERRGFASKSSAEQGFLNGPAGLLPIQQWYFENQSEDLSHYHQSTFLGISKSITRDELVQSFQALVAHHDSLRFVFTQTDEGWTQSYGTLRPEVLVCDLSRVTENFAATITAKCSEYKKTLNIRTGDIIRAVVFITPANEPYNRLLIVVHHLAVDGVSWRILLSDLETSLSLLKEGKQISLGAKSASCRQWYDVLQGYSLHPRLDSQQSYWQEVKNNHQPLQTDYSYEGPVKISDIGRCIVKLPAVDTQLLIQEVPKVYHTEINDLLLSALAVALTQWSGQLDIVIGLEAHGRVDSISRDIDISKTVGWFTSLYPVLLKNYASIGETIIETKERLRQVPDKGIGYGLLRYMRKVDSFSKNAWDVVFNYLGQFDNMVSRSTWMVAASEPTGSDMSENHVVLEKISINCFVQGGELVMYWGFSSQHFAESTITNLAENYISTLSFIISQCVDQARVRSVFTPSDFGLAAEMKQKELERFMMEEVDGTRRGDLITDVNRLSPLQEGMMFHGLYHSGGYVEQSEFQLEDIHEEALISSWQYILSRHTSLRSSFHYDAFRIPVQCTHKEIQLPVESLDLRNLNDDQQKETISRYKIADRAKGFDFKKPPLMRLALIRLTDRNWSMIWTHHHILIDGWSVPLMIGEILAYYESLVKKTVPPSQVEDNYGDFIQYLGRRDRGNEEEFWRKHLRHVEHSTLLCFISSVADRNKGVGVYRTMFLKFDKDVTSRIDHYAQKHRLTMNTIMQGIWSYLLHCYTGNRDVTFGVTVSGRPEDLPGVETRVGLYINTLPLFADFHDNNVEAVKWLSALQSEQVESRKFQYTSLSDIQRWVGITGDWFDTLLVFENYPVAKVITEKQWSLKITNPRVKDQTNYPLSLLIGSGELLHIRFDFNASLLNAAYVQQMCIHFENVLLQLIDRDDVCIAGIRLQTATAEQRLLSKFNHTSVDYGRNKSFVDLFEEQVIKSPAKTAVVFGSRSLTYKQLNEKANQLAHFLRRNSITTDSLVPICVERSFELIVGLLGILKAGAAYVPLDPEYPADRLEYMIADSQANLIISTVACHDRIGTSHHATVVLIDDPSGVLNAEPTSNISALYPNDRLTYVIYTSGSTGRPKGVSMPQHALFNLLIWHQENIGRETTDHRVLQFASVNFDASFQEIFSALCFGGAIYMISELERKDMRKMLFHIERHSINHLFIPYVVLNSLCETAKEESIYPKTLRFIFTAGEQLRLNDNIRLFSENTLVEIQNYYGPSETHVVTWYKVIPSDYVTRLLPPIGRPISNTYIYIVQPNGQLCDIGMTGELCIGGVQVARGYLRNEELTNTKFVNDRFGNTADKIYRTGDLARWLPDGNIDFLGRMDDQVKIRGNRVEPGEVEAVLLEHPLVNQCVIVANNDPSGHKRLVAYIVPLEQVTHDHIQRFLQSRVPDYMVPSIFIFLDRLPLTNNGKVDKRALPVPDTSLLVVEYTAPTNPVEYTLVSIWQELLAVQRIGIHNNFFELGGHSLLATRVISAIRRKIGAEVTIKDLFMYPTVSLLAGCIHNLRDIDSLPAIQPRQRETNERVLLSFSQERLWFIDQYEANSTQYHIPWAFRLKGVLDADVLEVALAEIITRHEVLRTVIRQERGRAYQHITGEDEWHLNRVDAISCSNEQPALKELIVKLISEPFDLSRDQMFRAYLIRVDVETHVFLIILHHIAFDGWSLGILMRELTEAYASAVEKTPHKLGMLPIQYADYAIWQRKYLEPALDKKLEFWKTFLKGLEPLNLPSDRPRSAIQSIRGSSVQFSISPQLAEGLKKFSNERGVTVFMTMLASFKVLLYRYSGQKDICVGTPIANRTRQEVEGLIGFFINTLALRTQMYNNPTFTELLQQVKENTLNAIEHQDVPFEKIVEAVVKERDQSRTPLFDVMFSVEDTLDVPKLRLGDVTVSGEPFEYGISKFDMTFSLSIRDTDNFWGAIEYCTDLYDESRIRRMIDHYQQLLQSILEAPSTRISQLRILAEQEEHQILEVFNLPVNFDGSNTIVDLFERQAAMTPYRIAVSCNGHSVSYGKLDMMANQFAHHLRSLGVVNETPVPICLDRNIELVVGILAIFKAGGAYVPIDPEYPRERIAYMLDDCSSAIVIVNEVTVQKIAANANRKLIDIGSDWPTVNLSPRNPRPSSHDVAYIIYTSGSTGRPKGAMIEHAGMLNHLQMQVNVFRMNEKSIVIQNARQTFDISVWQFLSALLCGGEIILYDNEKILDPRQFSDSLLRDKPTLLQVVPTYLSALLDLRDENQSIEWPSLEYLIITGEELPPSLVTRWFDSFPNKTIVNAYGPTEASDDVTFHFMDESNQSHRVSIGKPAQNLRIYIVDEFMNLCPTGINGEICVSGIGVGRGYMNDVERTHSSFVPDPFAADENAMMYKTGDLGCYQEDGTLLYLGRRDDQVKIRGHRIEIAEIEFAIQAHKDISAAGVAVVMNNGDKMLVGYYVSDTELNVADIQSFLSATLPDHMIPLIFLRLDVLPLNPNGKIDRKALPVPQVYSNISVTTSEASHSMIEQSLVDIWKKVLNRDQISVNDNFFQLGGHSLLVVQLLSAIQKEMQSELTIRDIFNNPTIAALAVTLQGNSSTSAPIGVGVRPDRIPLSFSQERLWFIDQYEGSTHYNMPSAFRLKGQIDVKLLTDALRTIIDRHEVLRTVILQQEGVAYMHILDKSTWTFSEIDGTYCGNDKAALEQIIIQLTKHPFNLSQDHPIRGYLVRVRDNDHVLVLTFHHIAFDGWSFGIFLREFTETYSALAEGRSPQLPQIAVQYADYAIWQRNTLKAQLDTKLEFWKNALTGIEPLNMPTDYPQPAIQSTRGALIHFQIDKSLTEALRDLSNEQGTTLFMVLLAAFNVLLSRYSGQKDICVGTPIANRTRQELETLIGFFINTVALRTEMHDDPGFTDLLQRVKQNTLAAFEHQDVPFEKVVEAVVKERDLSRSPLFQVMFSFEDTPKAPMLKLGELDVSFESFQYTLSKFDFSFILSVNSAQELWGAVEFCSDLYDESTMRRMIDHYQQLLRSIVEEPVKQISGIRMITNAEEQRLIEDLGFTAAAYPKGKSLVDLFEEQVEKTPDATAVVFDGASITYRQLDDWSNQLAHFLRQLGVAEETLVPICIDRQLEMIVGIMGILKSGGAYVPIDPEYPTERISYMLNDTAASVVVVSSITAERIAGEGRRLVRIDGEGDEIRKYPTSPLQSRPDAHNIAYVIYTSGSTGRPKGVIIEHRNVVRLFKTDPSLFDFNSKDVWTMFHSFCFDFSVWEIFGALLFGGKLVVVSVSLTKDSLLFARMLAQEGVTVLNQTPSAFYVLQQHLQAAGLSRLRYVIFGGEKLHPGKLKPIQEVMPACRLINMYGITETTVHVTCQEIGSRHIETNRSVIGRTIPTLGAFIMDEHQNLVPFGVKGELYVSGAGLARGYLNQVTLTSERFIENSPKVNKGRLYRSGDLACWLPDGTMEYFNRIDEQVKIRGYRIELEEIGNVLYKSGLVDQVVLTVKSDRHDNKRIVAFVVPVYAPIDRELLMNYAKSQLPSYMIPSLFVEMTVLPLTSNGKIDTRNLPDVDASELLTDRYEAPANDTEELLIDIWKDLLDVERVGANDNFFELGGDSIISIQVVSRLKKHGHEISPRDIFTHQTVAALANVIRTTKTRKYEAEQGILTGSCPLLPIQQWYFEQANGSLSHYNQAVIFGIRKEVDEKILTRAFRALIERHDSLRFIFKHSGSEWEQHYGEGVLDIETLDLTSTDRSSLGEVITTNANRFHANLDLHKGKLVSVVLFKTPASEQVNRLLIVIHHLAVDSVSWRILSEDIELLLSSLLRDVVPDLGEKSASYRQWHKQLEEYGRSKRLISQEKYWRNVIDSYFALPVDKPPIENAKMKDVKALTVKLPADWTGQLLREVPRAYRTDVNDILLSALARTICRWSGMTKVVFGLEGHGREDGVIGADVSRTVGWFTTMYPVCLNVASDDISMLVRGVKEQLREIPDKGIGYGILKYITRSEYLQRKQPYDLVFNYLGQLDTIFNSGDLLSKVGEGTGKDTSDEHLQREKIAINSLVAGGELIISWTYSNHHFEDSTIIELAAGYLDSLRKIIVHCVQVAKSGTILTPSDYGLGQEISVSELDSFLDHQKSSSKIIEF